MRTTSVVKLGSIAAAVAAATMWMAPAWGQTGPTWSQTDGPGPRWTDGTDGNCLPPDIHSWPPGG